jgi:hypothetical protein
MIFAAFFNLSITALMPYLKKLASIALGASYGLLPQMLRKYQRNRESKNRRSLKGRVL